MATYQGERYIAMQLRSILEQLSTNDEVIIVDDASTDDTRREISRFQDPRLVLLHNPTNQGVLRTFEKALSHSANEILFLSDQDDIWMPDKISTIVNAFTHDPELMLVASDATLIDEDGNQIGNSFYAQRGKFTDSLWANVLIGKFHGCTMAFRSALMQVALPFPLGPEVHHDTWIGCVNAMMGGKTRYIPAPLVAYRRHSTNVTGNERLSTYTRFQIRYQLVLGLLLTRIKLRDQIADHSCGTH